jgi:outer membrane lipoprotein-sorting protein
MKLIKRSIALAILFLTSSGIYAQTTDEIIAKHQAAMGSPEKWASVKSMVMKSKFNVQGMDIESKSSIVVGKSFRTEVEVMGNKIITVIDGEGGWMNRPAMMGGTGEPEDLPREQVKASVSQKNIGSSLLIAKNEGAKIELVSKEKLDGADVYLLKITKKSGEESQVFVSAATGFIVKAINKMNVQGQQVEAEVLYSNYKSIDGLFFPFTIETPSPMGGGNMVVETSSIDLNPALDASLFAKPAKK